MADDVKVRIIRDGSPGRASFPQGETVRLSDLRNGDRFWTGIPSGATTGLDGHRFSESDHSATVTSETGATVVSCACSCGHTWTFDRPVVPAGR